MGRTSALGLLISAAGFIGIATSINGCDYIVLLSSFAVWGAGLGILTPAIVSAALASTPRSPGMASGASNTSKQTGGALGVAIFSAIAGSTDGSGFLPRSVTLFFISASVFILTGLRCLAAAWSGETRRG